MKRLLGLAIFLGLAGVATAQNTSPVFGRVTEALGTEGRRVPGGEGRAARRLV